MTKLLEFLNGLNIGTIINIGLIILILLGGWYMGSKLGIIKGLNAEIEQLETDKAIQEQQIKEKNKKIKELDKKNVKLSKRINKLTGKYNDVKKGSNMDDAINKYRGK